MQPSLPPQSSPALMQLVSPNRTRSLRLSRALVCTRSGSAAPGSASITKRNVAAPPARYTPAWAWLHLKEMAAHYWNGSKLLYADTRIASKLLSRLLAGRTLTRREHQLLVRVCADIARLVPLAFFVIVPMMEFALPLAIRLFPNLLPSTFEEKHHVEEKRKKLLKVRMEMAQLLQHTLGERAIQVTKEEKAKAKRKADRAVLEAAMAEESTSGPAGAMSLVESRARELSRIVADTYTKEPVISAVASSWSA